MGHLDLLEGWSLAGLICPAHGHEAVEAGRTAGGQR